MAPTVFPYRYDVAFWIFRLAQMSTLPQEPSDGILGRAV
jgi:hypothetical protein